MGKVEGKVIESTLVMSSSSGIVERRTMTRKDFEAWVAEHYDASEAAWLKSHGQTDE